MTETKIALFVPEGQEWPVVARDPKTGHVILRPGFIEAVETASKLTPDSLTEDMVSALLVGWYAERLKAGYPRCPVSDELWREVLAEDGIPFFQLAPEQDRGGRV